MVFRANPVASDTVVIPPQPRSEASVAAHCRRIRSSIMSASNLYLIRIRLIVALFLTRPLSSELHLDATILLNLFFRGSKATTPSISEWKSQPGSPESLQQLKTACLSQAGSLL